MHAGEEKRFWFEYKRLLFIENDQALNKAKEVKVKGRKEQRKRRNQKVSNG
jgi:hypothetical protein